MKKIGFAILLGCSLSVQAQFEGLDADSLSRMMAGAGEMMACFGRLDETRLEALGKRAERIGSELEQLCTAGQRDQAQRRAQQYLDEFMAEPEYVQLMECGEVVQRMFPDLLDMSALDFEDGEHVCDSL